MTRRENFEKIAKAYYEAYYAQAIGLGKKPLTYEAWLNTDKSMSPGFAEDDAKPKEDNKAPNKPCGNQFYKDLEDTYSFLVGRGLLKRGTFDKFLEGFKELQDVANAVDKERGPAPNPPVTPSPNKPPKSLNQDEDGKEYNHPVWPLNQPINRTRETVYVKTPDGQDIYGDQAKQWLREHGNDNPFSWFGDFWKW